MWDLPGPGIEPVSPALAGRFLTTAPPGKSQSGRFLTENIHSGLECDRVNFSCGQNDRRAEVEFHTAPQSPGSGAKA